MPTKKKPTRSSAAARAASDHNDTAATSSDEIDRHVVSSISSQSVEGGEIVKDPQTETTQSKSRAISNPDSQPPSASSPAAASSSSPREFLSRRKTRNHSQGGSRDVSTDETSSDAFSSHSGPYQVIEYDLDGNQAETAETLRKQADNDGGQTSDNQLWDEHNQPPLTIEDDSPAAEAIKANANVHVSPFGKAARAVHMQTLRKLVKRATGKTRSGVVRGKPPRIPPSQQDDFEQQQAARHRTGLDTVPELADERDSRHPPPEFISMHHDAADVSASGSVTGDAPVAAPSLSAASASPQRHSRVPENGHLPDSVVAATVEASKKVLGSVDPHDMVKLLRWKRKKKDSRETLAKSYVKGKVIDGEHELYTLSIAVMIGVRTSISKTNSEINDGEKRRWVRPMDFRTTEKYEFRPKGGGLTPPHQLAHTFKFKDYSPVVFAYLRRLAGVNEFDFLMSVCGNANFIEFISNAKSGQFFFYSTDGRFLIKTMTNAESKFLRRMLPQYFKHCVENPNTSLARFFGMYRVKLYHLRRNVKFVIMNSVYFTDKYLQTFYDLKGSSIGRDAKPGQAVKKDNDLRRELPDGALTLMPNARLGLRKQLDTDCEFLERMGVMDYSMLVGVHHIPHTDDNSIATSGFKGNRSETRLRKSRPDEESLGESLTENDSQRSPKRDKEIVSVISTDNQAGRPSMHRRELSDNAGLFFLEDGLEEDDSSYLYGCEHRPVSDKPVDKDSECKKLVTIDKLYWPFHRLYDIHGHRRMVSVHCPRCDSDICKCHEKEDKRVLAGYNIPKFVAPLSERKDGGLEMDTAGLKLPMVFHGNQGPQLYCGKIFYMGIIDILQEYTSRKALESQYRWVQTGGKPEASAVPPGVYAQRFLNFFDEYTQRQKQETSFGAAEEDHSEGIEISARGEVFHGSGISSLPESEEK